MGYNEEQGRYQPRREQKTSALPDKYLDGGYFDEKGHIKPELITNVAESIARTLVEANVTSAQLRRFFGHVRSVEREFTQKGGGEEIFTELISQVQSLKPMVANYVGRAPGSWDRERREVFKKFIDRNVDKTLSGKMAKNFKEGFIPHFESIVAYYKYYSPGK